MTTFSNSLHGTEPQHYAVTTMSGEPGDPPANACAALLKIAAREEKLMSKIVQDDNDLVSLGWNPQFPATAM
jgi:hypothetical protein